jgi:hypothetical protein
MSIQRHQHTQGFALVATVSMMVLLTLVAIAMLSLSTIEQRSSGGGANEADRLARANARMALMIALGELQKAAGPDQRVSATATILGSATNPHANGTEAQDGRRHWVGVWDTSGYSPADPDNKTFVRWLVSGDQDQLDAIADAGTLPSATDFLIFEGVDASGNPDPDGPDSVKVPKVEVATATPGNSSYYAYWVEDEGVKADLAWNQGSFSDADREQAARLSAAPGPDHSVFSGPFATGVSHPLGSGSGYIDKLEKAFSPADMPLVMADTADHSAWLKANRHNMAMNVRGVIADVKKGGLRRDLSLAFEMDDSAESESASLFNQQTTEFVGNGDKLSSPYPTPGTSLNARHLFRDYGPKADGTPGAGNAFSDYITLRPPTSHSDPSNRNSGVIINPSPHASQERTIVRGPSWWLLRDYANLYKRLKTPSSGSGHAMTARAYFPNRSVTEDLVDLHAWNYGVGGGFTPVNRETSNDKSVYAHRPVKASYAPVLLSANALFSLVYEGDQLKLVVDPFFIVWNPYNTHITADKFAITMKEGFLGGVLLKHTLPDGTTVKHYGKKNGDGGSDTIFADYAKKSSAPEQVANMSYLISNLEMTPGEVKIFSSPDEALGSGNDNVLYSELEPGMNYNATDSGIFFDEFPEYPPAGGNLVGWTTVNVPSSESASHTLEAIFNLHGVADWAQKFMIEASLPAPGTLANQLTTEANFGDNLSGWEYRISRGRGRPIPNCNKGSGTAVNFTFSELSATKKSFGIISMLNLPTDHPSETGYIGAKMEVFSQLNVTPVVRSLLERQHKHPLNVFTTAPSANGINNLMAKIGIDIDAFGDGSNGFYGKSYALAEGDSHFPLIDIPKAPMHSLVQLSGANIGIRLFEPTNAIGNSWKPPYIPQDSIYLNSATFLSSTDIVTLNDVSWQANDALFDRYYFSGIAPGFDYGGGTTGTEYRDTGTLKATLDDFYGVTGTSYEDAEANPALEPHVPSGKTSDDVVADLNPNDAQYNTTTNIYDGYKKVGAYSLIKGAFNVNSTSVQAWRAFLQGNKALALESAQGTTDSETGTPFPLASTTSDTSSNNGWEKFSRLSDDQIWDDNDTPSDLTDDAGLAVEIVNQVKARGPFMSISDLVNRRIAKDIDFTAVPNVEDTDPRAYQGAIQEAIEQAGVNGVSNDVAPDYGTGIRGDTSDVQPNYDNFSHYWRYQAHNTWYDRHEDFPYAAAPYASGRNCATGVPKEINQANILLPLAPKLAARTDTFRIRAYGEVRDADDNIIAQATCEAVVQRLPGYMDAKIDPNDDGNEPWDDDSETPTLNTTNQTYGRRFEIRSFRWLDNNEV